jgi:hypothetical protein
MTGILRRTEMRASLTVHQIGTITYDLGQLRIVKEGRTDSDVTETKLLMAVKEGDIIAVAGKGFYVSGSHVIRVDFV